MRFGRTTARCIGVSLGAVVLASLPAAAQLSAVGNQLWHQDIAGIVGTAEANDFFGSSLSVGDMDGDGSADLVVGAWGEGIGALDDAGAVHILYSSGSFSTASSWEIPRLGRVRCLEL